MTTAAKIALTTLIAISWTAFYAQKKEMEFATPIDYLQYVTKEFKIPAKEIYYFSTESDSLNKKLEKYGILLLISDNRISTVQEVADKLKSQCSPKSLLPKATEEAINEASSPSMVFERMIIKNLATGNALTRENSKFAIYIFSHRFKKNARLYYNEREHLEKLGYKTVVLTIDGAYIKELKDIDKTPVYIN